MDRVAFSVPGRPKGKERPRFERKTGRVYTPPATVAEEKAILQLFKLAHPRHQPFTGPVKLTVIAVFAIPPSWPRATREAAQEAKVWHVARGQLDLDNAVKLVSDALNGHAFVDDAQVAVITAGKRYGSPERLEVVLESLEQLLVPATPGQQRLEERISEARLPSRKAAPATPTKSKSAKPTTPLEQRIAAALERDARQGGPVGR